MSHADLPRLRLEDLSTPCYVYDAPAVVSSYRQLRECLGTPLIVSIKANCSVDLLRAVQTILGDGVEVASIGELELLDGVTKTHVSVNNPSMTESLMRAAMDRGAILTIDSLSQLDRLASVRGRRPELMLRVNTASLLQAPRRFSSAGDHFGLSREDLPIAAERSRALGCQLNGLHFFDGSNSFATRGAAVAHAAFALAEELERSQGLRLRRLNLGGGFPADWPSIRSEIATYAAGITPFRDRWELVHEAGRAIFANAGSFVTRVVATKRLGGELVAVCDGGMAQSFLLARTEGVLRKPSTPLLVSVRENTPAGSPCPVRYVGSTCSPADVIGYDAAPAHVPEPGDICIFSGCGAYHRTYTVASFLMLPAAATYVTQ